MSNVWLNAGGEIEEKTKKAHSALFGLLTSIC